MDFVAITLITVTAVTILGICIFIFVCALQPRFLSKLHSHTIEGGIFTSPTEENIEQIQANSNNKHRASSIGVDLTPSNQNERTERLKMLEGGFRHHNSKHNRLNIFSYIRRIFQKHHKRKTFNQSIESLDSNDNELSDQTDSRLKRHVSTTF